jgi:uncharacterized membrane protein
MDTPSPACTPDAPEMGTPSPRAIAAAPARAPAPGRILAMPRWVFFSLLALAIWSLWGLAYKLPSRDLSAYAMVVITSIGMVPGSLLLVASPRLGRGSRPRLGFLYGVAAGLCGRIGDFLMFKAMLAGGLASIVVSLTGMFPLLTAVLAFVLFRERLNRLQMLGILGSLVALGLFNVGSADDQGVRKGWFDTLGSTWMLYSIGAFVLYGLAGVPQKLATRYGSDELATIAFTTASVSVSTVFLFTSAIDWSIISTRDWVYCLLIGVLTSAGALAAFAAYRWGKVSLVTALTSLYPAATALLAIVVLGEKLTWVVVAAIVLSKVAGVLMSLESPGAEAAAAPGRGAA